MTVNLLPPAINLYSGWPILREIKRTMSKEQFDFVEKMVAMRIEAAMFVLDIADVPAGMYNAASQYLQSLFESGTSQMKRTATLASGTQQVDLGNGVTVENGPDCEIVGVKHRQQEQSLRSGENHPPFDYLKLNQQLTCLRNYIGICKQCGKCYADNACGPTHATIAEEKRDSGRQQRASELLKAFDDAIEEGIFDSGVMSNCKLDRVALGWRLTDNFGISVTSHSIVSVIRKAIAKIHEPKSDV